QGTHKVAAKYWRVDARKGWRFADEEVVLTRHTDHITERFVTLNNAKSPFDGDWAYWAKRMGRYPGIPERTAKLLQRQDGKCALCGLHITFNDPIEVDHIQPQILGGKDHYTNLQLVHGHCHDQKTAVDGSLLSASTSRQAQFIEEPDEAKVSRPVLKESSLGRPNVRL
ncbi:MAG TPA: HNH endonuclease signature motif containing protein, partial [Chroococcidiopsis sp.]